MKRPLCIESLKTSPKVSKNPLLSVNQGLGLYIVHEVVAAHGGQVAMQSTVGAGTTFTITLPLVEP